MASISKKRKSSYQGSDILDSFLIDQAVKHINYAKLVSLAKHLEIPKSKYLRVLKSSHTKIDKLKNVSVKLNKLLEN